MIVVVAAAEATATAATAAAAAARCAELLFQAEAKLLQGCQPAPRVLKRRHAKQQLRSRCRAGVGAEDEGVQARAELGGREARGARPETHHALDAATRGRRRTGAKRQRGRAAVEHSAVVLPVVGLGRAHAEPAGERVRARVRDRRRGGHAGLGSRPPAVAQRCASRLRLSAVLAVVAQTCQT